MQDEHERASLLFPCGCEVHRQTSGATSGNRRCRVAKTTNDGGMSDCVSLGYPAVEVDMQMEAFAAAAGVDLEVRGLGVHEANAVIATLLQLVAHLVGVMAGWLRRP